MQQLHTIRIHPQLARICIYVSFAREQCWAIGRPFWQERAVDLRALRGEDAVCGGFLGVCGKSSRSLRRVFLFAMASAPGKEPDQEREDGDDEGEGANCGANACTFGESRMLGGCCE